MPAGRARDEKNFRQAAQVALVSGLLGALLMLGATGVWPFIYTLR